MTITRRITSAAAAAVLGFATLSPAPVRAGNDEATNIIAGLIGVAILGALINELNDDPPPAAAYTTAPVAPVTRNNTVTRNITVNRSYNQPHVRPLPPYMQRYVLPSQCVKEGRNRHSDDALLRSQCLEKHFAYSESLPHVCAIRHWNKTQSELRKSYNLNCLERHGYRVAGR